MGLIKYAYINKCKSIKKKIDEINEKNSLGYSTFYEYVIADELLLNYFNELKNIEKKYPDISVDSYETFENKIYCQLYKIYISKLIPILKLDNKQEKILELNELKNNVEQSLNHNFDIQINKILEDLNYKIKNYDKFRVVNKPIEKTNEDDSFYDEYEDPIYDEVVDFAVHTGKISASLIQRKFRLGYNRAARLIDLLEERGIIGPQIGSMPREVLLKLDGDIDIELLNKTNNEVIEEIPDREYQILKIKENQQGKTIDNIMKEYGINIEYNNNQYLIKIMNTLILNVREDNNKVDFIKKILKYISPIDMKLFLIDIDKLTFSNFEGLPHLYAPIYNNILEVESIFKDLFSEVNNRLDLFVKNHVKSIEEYRKNNSLHYYLVVIEEISDIISNKTIYELLLKILLNGERVGIKIIMFSRFSKKNLPLGPIEDLVKIYDKYNFNDIFVKNTTSFKSLDIIQNDMSGFDFENYSAELLNANGFEKIKVTKASGDFGVDIIAYKDDIKYSIQCKKYSSPVGIRAVQEVITSKAINDSHVAVVLTNNSFTKSAKILAEKNNVLLWGREKLDELISNYKLNQKN